MFYLWCLLTRCSAAGSARPHPHLLPAGREHLLLGSAHLQGSSWVRSAEPDVHWAALPRRLQDRHGGGARAQAPPWGSHQSQSGQQQSQGHCQTSPAHCPGHAHYQTQDQLLLGVLSYIFGTKWDLNVKIQRSVSVCVVNKHAELQLAP